MMLGSSFPDVNNPTVSKLFFKMKLLWHRAQKMTNLIWRVLFVFWGKSDLHATCQVLHQTRYKTVYKIYFMWLCIFGLNGKESWLFRSDPVSKIKTFLFWYPSLHQVYFSCWYLLLRIWACTGSVPSPVCGFASAESLGEIPVLQQSMELRAHCKTPGVNDCLAFHFIVVQVTGCRRWKRQKSAQFGLTPLGRRG